MCCGCWKEAGSPRTDNEKVHALAARIEDIYDFGALHIIVDDWNLENSHIDFCEKEIETDLDSSESEKQKEREFLALMREMTLDERYSAFALQNGCP